MTIMAKKIDVTGIETMLPDAKLETLQAAVGGYIDMVHFPGGGCLVVNDEGLLLRLPINEKATAIVKCVYSRYDGPIVGNAVLCGKGEIK
jgi:hypothetical protein